MDSLEFARLLADPTRQKIMRLCCCRWRNVSEIAEAVEVSQPTVSHHLARLHEAGFVTMKREGKFIYYTLDQGQVANCCQRLLVELAPEVEATAQLLSL